MNQYLVLCRGTKSKDKLDTYLISLSNKEEAQFLSALEDSKFVWINEVLVNTSEILRVIPYKG